MDPEITLNLIEKLRLKDPTVTAVTLVDVINKLIDEHTQQQQALTDGAQRIKYLEAVTKSLRGITQELSKLI